jgi:hypothetical protein
MSCAICLEDDAQKEFFVTDCNHVFHKECLLSIKEQPEKSLILRHHFTILNCPLCRYKLSLYDLNYKSFSTEILDHNIYKQIKCIYKQFKKLHLNPNYVFISGGFATALYSKLTNKNNIQHIYNDIDIYYIDYHDLYDKNKKSVYSNKCEYKNPIIKDVKKGVLEFGTDKTTLVTNYIDYDVIYLENLASDDVSHSNVLESNMLLTFDNFDLACCKIAFTVEDDHIKFYIHNDYYRKSINLCYYSWDRTLKRVEKYNNRGHEISKTIYCCLDKNLHI